MIEPKPLTKERREEITEKMAIIDWFNAQPAHPEALQFIRDLLAAEQFWREAVKNAAETRVVNEYDVCNFCEADDEAHKPDCPWLLSQDEPMKENS